MVFSRKYVFVEKQDKVILRSVCRRSSGILIRFFTHARAAGLQSYPRPISHSLIRDGIVHYKGTTHQNHGGWSLERGTLLRFVPKDLRVLGATTAHGSRPLITNYLWNYILRVRSFQAWMVILYNRSGGRFSKVPKAFRARKAIHKTPTRLFCEAGLFICCKGNKNLNNCKVSCLETPLFWRYKENYVTRKTPEKVSGLLRNGRQAPTFSKVPKLFRHITGATIPFISSQRRGFKPSKFAILLVFLTLKTC